MSNLEIIKALCKEKGISLSALEKEMGYSNGSLSKGSKIPAERLYELAEYFDKPMEYLLTGEDTRDEAVARDSNEKNLLLLYRNFAGESPQTKERLVKIFEKSIDLYLAATDGKDNVN